MKKKKIKTRRVNKKPSLSKSKRKRTRKKTSRKTRKKKVSVLILTKPEECPIISPRAENNWETWQTFNPAVILLDDRVHIFYRAIGEDGISRLGYAISGDGFKIDERLSYPVYQHQFKK